MLYANSMAAYSYLNIAPGPVWRGAYAMERHSRTDDLHGVRADRFAKQLSTALYELGISHKQLAQELDVPRYTVDSWTRGDAKIPSGANLDRLCNMLEQRQPGLGSKMATLAGQSWPLPSSLSLHLVEPAPANTNIPLALTSFIGRERELATVKSLLQTTRLLTLTGAGGVGKTRLALQAGRELVPAFADGVWLVELAAVDDTGLVPQAVSALGLREKPEPGHEMLATLTDQLLSRRLLLILDNCEHVMTACTSLAVHLLQLCPHLTIMATSRETLGIMGLEIPWQVPPLSVPDPNSVPPLDEMREYEAVHLFLERARASLPDFRLTEQNAGTVAQICRRLDGLPLAIELAAARLRGLSLDQIVANLDNRFWLLTGGSKATLPRHQTLQATIDWSYDLLDEQERHLFSRLSVFASAWTLPAAEEVCSDPDEIENPKSRIQKSEVLDLLMQLVDKSLVIAETQGSEAQYRMLENIRAYARAKLDDRQAYERMVKYYASFVEGHTTAYDLLEREANNILAALQIAYDGEMPELLVRLANGFCHFLDTRGLYSLAKIQLRRAQQAAMELHDEVGLEATLLNLGRMAERRGEYAQAETLYLEGLELARAHKHGDRTSALLQNLGGLVLKRGEYERAERYLLEGLALARPVGDSERISALLGNLGVLAGSRGDHAGAEAYFRESLDFARPTGHRARICALLQNLGAVAGNMGNYAQAEEYYSEGLDIARQIGHKELTSYLLQNLGATAINRGDYKQAEEYFQQGLEVAREIEHRERISHLLEKLGELARITGNCERAEIYLLEGLDLAREMGHRERVSHLLMHLGAATGTLGNYAQAEAYLRESLDTALQIGHRWFVSNIQNELGELYLMQERWDEADEVFNEALLISREVGSRDMAATALYGLARLALAHGEAERARRLSMESLQIFRAIEHSKAQEVEGLLREI